MQDFEKRAQEPVPVDWGNSHEATVKVSDLSASPLEGVPFADLPSAATIVRNYDAWKKDYASWLFRTQKLHLLKSSTLNEYSRPGETERDFRVRLQQAAKEHRGHQVGKLRRKYASDFKKLDEKMRRAETARQRQEARARGQKYQTAVSFGETLLGSFLGWKTTRTATRTTRDVGRSMKKSKDVESAKANLKALQQERNNLEAQFQSEVNALEMRTNLLTEQLEEISITPVKTNISIRLVTLVWCMTP